MQLKERIAVKHHERKLKMKCYLRLKHAADAVKVNDEFVSVMELHAIYLYFNFNVLQCLKDYYDAREDYLLKVLFEKNYKTRVLKSCFRKLQFYAKELNYRKNLSYKASCFFQFKYGAKLLLNYFQLWRKYTFLQLEEKYKSEKAFEHFNYRIKQLCFFKLRNYAIKRNLKNDIKTTIVEYFQEHLMKKCLKHWKVFVANQQEKRLKIAIADDYYESNLIKKSFLKLKKYKMQKDELRLKLELFSEAKTLRWLRFCFDRLKNYTKAVLLKKENNLRAVLFYERNLLQKTFVFLRKYAINKKLKQMRLQDFAKAGQKIWVKYCFRKWRNFLEIVAVKKIKTKTAETHYKFSVLKHYFDNLRKFNVYKKQQTQKRAVVERHFLRKLTIVTFANWRKFLEEQKMFKINLVKAQIFYRNNLEKSVLRVILEAGIGSEQEKERRALQQIFRKYTNVYKYFKIWKNRINKQNGGGEEKVRNMAIFETFEWNPLCFEKPRIPEFLRHKM